MHSHEEKKVFTRLCAVYEKLSRLHDSVTCRTTFSSNNLKVIAGICLCTSLFKLISGFKLNWDSDFDWTTATSWFFSFVAIQLCRFAAAEHGIIVLLHYQVWSKMALVYRGVHVQRNYCKVSSPNLSSTLQRCASQLVWGVFADMMCLVFIKPLPRSCYREEAFYCHPFETSHTFLVFSLVGLSWTWTCNMLPEACRVWDEALVYLFVFFPAKHCTVWPRSGYIGMFSPGKTVVLY